MGFRDRLTSILERISQDEQAVVVDHAGNARSNRGFNRAVNPSAPDIDPDDVIKSPDLSKQPSFVESYGMLRGTDRYIGRQTQPSNANFFGNIDKGNLGMYFIPKKEPQTITIEDIDAGAWSPGGLVNVLIDISPDVSKGLWNNLRLSGTSVLFKAIDDEGADDPTGQKWVDDAIKRINTDFGGVDNLICQSMLSVYVYGALATDSEIGLDLAETGDLFTVLPDSIWFQRDANQKPIPFQLQYLWGIYGGGPTMANFSNLPYRRLNTATFAYTPLDPGIDDPYGRGPFWPVLQVIFFLAQLLRDLQRFVENQAWGRTDFTVEWEVLQKMMERIAPADLNSADKITAFIKGQLDVIKNEYSSLSPQDAYVHPSWVTVNNQNAASPRNFDVVGVVDIVRSQIIAAIKGIPAFAGMDVSSSGEESATNFEILVHSIERVRDICTYHIARHLQLNCFMHGCQTNVAGVWKPVRTTQRLADAQAQAVEIQNGAAMEQLGLITHDQLAESITGTSAVKEADWDMYQPKKGPGEGEVAGSTGSVPKGEDKKTSTDTVKGSTKSKNARALFRALLDELDNEVA